MLIIASVKVGVPKETAGGESRVGLVPETVGRLVADGIEVILESGAGRGYNLDDAYRAAGAEIADESQRVYGEADVILKIQRPAEDEIEMLGEGQTLVCMLNGPVYPDLVEKLARRGVTVFSVEAIPRISRAQSMDVLSAMGSISGYKCVLIGANTLGKYLPMMTTAAGTTKAARVLVLGAGVAGLQSIATARRLGAEVYAFDIRPEVKEQIESLGATFLESGEKPEDTEEEEYEEYEPRGFAKLMAALGFNSFAEPPEEESRNGASASSEDDEAEDTGGYARVQAEEKQEQDRRMIKERLAEIDLVITTALVPGKKAPILLTRDMVEAMRPGSVIVDLAAENGGNCELTSPGETVEHEQVKIIGPVNVPAMVPVHASQLYARNMQAILNHLIEKDEESGEVRLNLDFEDEITVGACLTHAGGIRHDPTREALNASKESR